jgi:hypothetical protein
MKSKTNKLISALLAATLVFGLFAAMPLTASAADGTFQVTLNPVGATYMLNEAAVPLKATFEYSALAGLGTIHSDTPIKVQWYWSYANSNTGRINGFGESTVPYDRIITYTTTLTPATDIVGIKYYYAVLSYAESVSITSGQSQSVPKEAVTAPARIEVIDNKTPRLIEDDHFAYMQGYPNGTFRQNQGMTRAEAVVMFSRLLLEEMETDTDYRYDCYPDVDPAAPAAKWYANPVCYMHSLGALEDYSRDDKFRPNDPVTRAEFATLVSHFAGLALTDTNIFSDVPNSHWAAKYINSAAAYEWIKGYPDETFRPDNNISRAEVVTLVNRRLNRNADEEYLAANLSSLPRTYSDITTSHWAYLAVMEASTGHDYIKDSADERWTAVYP